MGRVLGVTRIGCLYKSDQLDEAFTIFIPNFLVLLGEPRNENDNSH